MAEQISVSAQAAVESLISSLHDWLIQLVWYSGCQVTSIADADLGWVVCRIQDGTNQRCKWKRLFSIAVGDYVDVLYDPRTMQFEVFKPGGATIWSDTTFNIDQDSVRVEYTNSSTGTLNLGEVVVFDSGADLAVDTTTTAGDLTVAGVVVVGGAVGSTIQVAQFGVAHVLVNGNVTRGQFLRTSTTRGYAEPVSTTLYPGTFGIALTGNASGAGGTVQAFLVGHTWDTADFDTVVTFENGLTMDGVSGANIVTIPTAQAIGLTLVDTNAVEYLRVDTAPQLVFDVNNAGADIDIYLRSVGVNGIFVQGSDGALTVGGPSMTVPDGWTLGQAAGPLLTFDDALNYLEITGCSVGIGIAVPTQMLTMAGNIDFSVNADITQNTADASDNRRIRLCGGGAVGSTRGGYMVMYGNEYVGSEGVWAIGAGNDAAAGYMNFATQGLDRMRILRNGNIGIGTVAPGSLTEWNFADEDLEFVDAHTAQGIGSVEAVVEVITSTGATGYMAIYDSYVPP